MSKREVEILTLAIVAAALTGCMRNVRVWPPPLATGTAVTVRFTAPRIIVVHDANGLDSVAGVKELRGQVVRRSNDTLVVLVSNARSTLSEEPRADGREVQLLLDQSTVITASEIDGWKFAYLLLAGAVFIFAGMVMSGS